MKTQLSRRRFLTSLAAGTAMTSVDWRAWAAEEGLPAYYGGHLARVSARINRLAPDCPAGFFFITDLHVKANQGRSGRILAKLIAETDVKNVLCGGDLVTAFGGKTVVDESAARYRANWVAPVERAGGAFYPAKGNHDFTIRETPTSRNGYTYTGRRTRDILMETAAVKTHAVTNPDDPEACYYYVDVPGTKIRYVVADTTDSILSTQTFWAVAYGMQDRQLHWLAERALATIPAGWHAVVMHHIPVTSVVGGPDKNAVFAPWRRILEAYQNRRRVTVGGKTYDFSHAKGTLLLDLTGHCHAERQTFQNGLWHATLPCDAAYGDYIAGSLPWCAALPAKKKGTVYEQTFDAVQVDPRRGLIHFTRVGGGADRTFHLARRTVRAGETAAFRTTVLGDGVKWNCYDADRVTRRPNPKNKYQFFYDYFNDLAGISPDGILTARKAGDAVVLATAPSGEKELFAVTVV